MSIQKKSLISTLKTAKKANVAAENKGEKQVSAIRIGNFKGVGTMHAKGAKSFKSLRMVSNKIAG